MSLSLTLSGKVSLSNVGSAEKGSSLIPENRSISRKWDLIIRSAVRSVATHSLRSEARNLKPDKWSAKIKRETETSGHLFDTVVEGVMGNAPRFIISPGAFNRRVPHPLTDILQLLLVAQHEIGEALSAAIECRVRPEVVADHLVQRSLEAAALNNPHDVRLAFKYKRDQLPTVSWGH